MVGIHCAIGTYFAQIHWNLNGAQNFTVGKLVKNWIFCLVSSAAHTNCIELI